MSPVSLLLAASLARADEVAPPPLDELDTSAPRSRRDAAVVLYTEDYANLPDVPDAARDGEAVIALLVARGVDPARIRSIENPTRAGIRADVSAAARDVKRKGTLWVYFAGHGLVDADVGRVLVGAEADPAAPMDASVPLADVVEFAAGSKADRVVILVDAPFNGRSRDGEPLFPDAEAEPAPPPAWVDADSRVSVWLAANGAERAPRWEAAGHGLFTYFAVGALAGWADALPAGPDGKLTLAEAQAFVAKSMRAIGGTEPRPSKDARSEVGAWVLGQGGLAEAPPKEAMAALALAEKTRRVEAAQAALRASAAEDWATVGAAATTATPEATEALRGFVARWDTAVVTVDGAEIGVPVEQVVIARQRLDDWARQAKKGKKRRRGAPPKTAPPPQTASVAAPKFDITPCKDALALEPRAMMGEIGPDLEACVEARIASEPTQTTRDKLSRLLLVDAEASGDAAGWASLVERHLDVIDRSDPDLCFKWALHLSRGDVDDAELVLRWVEYALDNKHVWTGTRHVARVFGLLQLRAETASRLWLAAEADFVEDRSDENSQLADHARGRAKDYAREWLDYARTSGQPEERARDLCDSAAGSREFCAG